MASKRTGDELEIGRAKRVSTKASLCSTATYAERLQAKSNPFIDDRAAVDHDEEEEEEEEEDNGWLVEGEDEEETETPTPPPRQESNGDNSAGTPSDPNGGEREDGTTSNEDEDEDGGFGIVQLIPKPDSRNSYSLPGGGGPARMSLCR